ncbi:Catechol 2,3-dioxygenase [Catalinimonas alkaloidigena]|uniref:Catechol 2,3-dioxygenase n=1 Tax=Catalinimonas alkaloidigena TaxID=1075417 RepID=A0A1G9PF73_9BACT|nr:VOC family protein [Catalinimonas alkaloidigena]SDL97364.1 Catechol 2,3-dioxygenase [Catalinimonas alkaloidigena]
MKINLTSVPVDDQEKALRFYTDVLGFVKKTEIPMGEHRWLTVVSPEERDGTELLLEPMGFAPAQVYQRALFEAGIPYTTFQVDDVQQTYERLQQRGVVFSVPPTEMGTAKLAVFEDTCGNHLQIAQVM